jgi:hypothetical protein
MKVYLDAREKVCILIGMKIKTYKVSFRLAASDSTEIDFTVNCSNEDEAIMEIDGVSVEGSWFAYNGNMIATIKTTRI